MKNNKYRIKKINFADGSTRYRVYERFLWVLWARLEYRTDLSDYYYKQHDTIDGARKEMQYRVDWKLSKKILSTFTYEK